MRLDKKDLMVFFERNSYLTTMEQAQMAGVSTKTIQRWKHKCGIKLKNRGWGSGYKERPFVGTKMKKEKIEIIHDRNIWNNKEWFVEMYVQRGYTGLRMAKMINRDHALVRMKLKKFGIPIRSHSEVVHSKNPCCSREWLEEHYEILEMSANECAKLAKVNFYTIHNWLVKFGMPIRDIYESQYGHRNPFYGKRPCVAKG